MTMYPSPKLSCNRLKSGLRLIAWALPVLLLSSVCIAPRAAARENPMLLLLRNSVYGGACGLLLGGVLTLVVDKNNRGDVVRWGVVAGTFSGFGYGIYELSTGRGWEEFSHRTIQDTPPLLSSGDNGHDGAGQGFDPGSVAIPLRLQRALGRSPAEPAGRLQDRIRPARPGFRLATADGHQTAGGLDG